MAMEVITDDLSPAEARHLRSMETRIERGMHTFRVVGEALMDIRDKRLYRQTHSTFETYCRDRWDMTRERAYQFIGASEVVKVLGSAEDEGPVNEAQARELVVVARNAGNEAVQHVWRAAQESGKPLTAAVLREEARKVISPEKDPAPTITETLAVRLVAVTALYARWKTSKPTRKERAVIAAAVQKFTETVG